MFWCTEIGITFEVDTFLVCTKPVSNISPVAMLCNVMPYLLCPTWEGSKLFSVMHALASHVCIVDIVQHVWSIYTHCTHFQPWLCLVGIVLQHCSTIFFIHVQKFAVWVAREYCVQSVCVCVCVCVCMRLWDRERWERVYVCVWLYVFLISN